jgi:hypothetical protein
MLPPNLVDCTLTNVMKLPVLVTVDLRLRLREQGPIHVMRPFPRVNICCFARVDAWRGVNCTKWVPWS